jgi:GNAT superfamily N-acetyltransferase
MVPGMTTLRHYAFVLDDATCRHLRAVAMTAAPGVIEPCDLPDDSDGITRLVAACRGDGSGMAAGLRAEGLLAELASRKGRAVRGWVYRVDDGTVAGLVCLLESGAAERRRYSIPWLLVAPSSRRGHVGSRLVIHALQAACAAGADVVHAETKDDWHDAVALWDRLTLWVGRRS